MQRCVPESLRSLLQKNINKFFVGLFFQKRPSNQTQNSMLSPPCTQVIGLLWKGAQSHTALSSKTTHNLVMEPLADRRCTFCFVNFPPPWFLKRRVGGKTTVQCVPHLFGTMWDNTRMYIYIYTQKCLVRWTTYNKVRSQSDELQSRLFWLYTPYIALIRALLNGLRTIPHARYTRSKNP